MCFPLCFGFSDFVLDFVLRIFGFCASRCASDFRILCLILCCTASRCASIFPGFCVQFVASRCASMCVFFSGFCAGFCAPRCASDFRILGLILRFSLRFGFRIVLNLVLVDSNRQKSGARETRNWSTRSPEFSFQLRLRKSKVWCSGPWFRAPGHWFWCSRPLVLVLPGLGSGAPGPWF